MIALGSDHAGFEYKEHLKNFLLNLERPYQDFGTSSAASVDYPDFAHVVSKAVASGKNQFGILICGTGIGMSIVANKHKESVPLFANLLSQQNFRANIMTPTSFVSVHA